MRHITVLLTAAMIIIAALTACSKPIEKMSAAELLDLGEKYLIEMNYEQAIVYFEKLIEVEQMNPRGYTGLAVAYIGQENYDAAIGALRSDTELLPDNMFLADAAELL